MSDLNTEAMKKYLFLLWAVLSGASSATAQSADDLLVQQAVNQLVAKKTFLFVAQRVIGSRISQSVLQAKRELTINKDTLTVNLPYIGKGASASDNQMGNPLSFTSTDFTYDVEFTKKGGKIITMDVKSPNGTERFKFMLTINDGINAQLSITSATRSPMNFSGFIQEIGALDALEE